jgi:hypothetical protein
MKPTPAQLIDIADHILADLLDRRGIRQELEEIKLSDKEVWREIQLAIGQRAWAAVHRERGGSRG